MQLGRVWAVVLLVLVASAAVTEAKRGKGRGKKARKFGNRGITKNFKTEASRAYYNHNGVSIGMCWRDAGSWVLSAVQKVAPRCCVVMEYSVSRLISAQRLCNFTLRKANSS